MSLSSSEFTTEQNGLLEDAQNYSQNVSEYSSNYLCEAPEFIKRLSPSIEVESGASITLECSYIASPKPSVTWYKDGEKINDELHEMEFDNSGARLTIHDAQKSNEGAYKCKIENPGGIASTTGYVSITGGCANITLAQQKRQTQRNKDIPTKKCNSRIGSSSYGTGVSNAPNLCQINEQRSMEEMESIELFQNADETSSKEADFHLEYARSPLIRDEQCSFSPKMSTKNEHELLDNKSTTSDLIPVLTDVEAEDRLSTAALGNKISSPVDGNPILLSKVSAADICAQQTKSETEKVSKNTINGLDNKSQSEQPIALNTTIKRDIRDNYNVNKNVVSKSNTDSESATHKNVFQQDDFSMLRLLTIISISATIGIMANLSIFKLALCVILILIINHKFLS